MSGNEAPKAVVLDIEGTTTPVTFVYDVLFPYARDQMATFLAKQWDNPNVLSDLQRVQEQHTQDVKEGLKPPSLSNSQDEMERCQSYVAYLLWQMDHDRKTTGLKSMQGKIWKLGYDEGDLKGELFEDVAGVLQKLHEKKVPVYIYSSGSIQAQKLLFGQTVQGDMLPYLSGHFDTTTGPKRIASSYQAIAEAIKSEPSTIVFATDVVEEADAAVEAGMKAVILERPGNHPQPEHSHPVWTSLEPLLSFSEFE